LGPHEDERDPSSHAPPLRAAAIEEPLEAHTAEPSDALETEPLEASERVTRAEETPEGQVLAALARALERASAAGEWATVREITRELEARRGVAAEKRVL
jgi:hypothetical protein